MAVTVRGQKQTQNCQPAWGVPRSMGLEEGPGVEPRGWAWLGIGGASGPKGFQGTL